MRPVLRSVLSEHLMDESRFIIHFSDIVKDKPINLIAYKGLVFLQSKRAEINYQKYDTSSLNHSNSESIFLHHYQHQQGRG